MNVANVYSIAYVRHQPVANRLAMQGRVKPEIHMSVDEARHELGPIYARIPCPGILRHTPQRALHEKRVTSATYGHPPGAVGRAPVCANCIRQRPAAD